jgi:hypothetical protein
MKRKCGKNDPFVAVGMARVGGKLKLRWSNDPAICRTAYKSRGETDIIMVKLSEGLSKSDCVKYLKHRAPEFHGEEHMNVINEYLEKHL